MVFAFDQSRRVRAQHLGVWCVLNRSIGDKMLRFLIVMLMTNALVGISAANAKGFEDLLKEVLEGYVEKKKEGLTTQATDNLELDDLKLVFTGAAINEPDIFESLHQNTGTSGGLNSNLTTAEELKCFDRVQNKIAWDRLGRKSWSPGNIKRLCKGTTVGSAPPICFSTAMFNESHWGKKNHQIMSWSLAVQLCKGTSNAVAPINCLRTKIGNNLSLQESVNACGSKAASGYVVAIPTLPVFNKNVVMVQAFKTHESDCINHVQGKIAWDKAGKQKRWAAANVNKLCKGTKSAYAPGTCFKYTLSNGKAWGEKPFHHMDWKFALDLCEGTSNANATTQCFKNAIATGKTLSQAVNQCDR